MSWQWQPLLAGGAQLLVTTVAPAVAAELSVYPSQLRGRPALAHTMQALAHPDRAPAPRPAVVPQLVAYPSYLPGRARVAHRMQALAHPERLLVVTVPGRGPDGVATLILDIADACATTYSFRTDVITSKNGLENRASMIGCPRESYEFSTVLTDGQIAAIQSAIVYQGALGAVFQVALTYEALRVSALSTGTVINVPTTTLSDWVYPGSRVVLVAFDGSRLAAVVQSSTATTITVDVSLGAFGAVDTLVVPTTPCYLSPVLQAGQYAVNAGRQDLKVTAILFGNATSDWSPVGATVNTYSPPSGGTHPVWDRGVGLDDTSPRGVVLGSQVIDRGAVVSNYGSWLFSNLAREIEAYVATDADRQYLKAFIGAVAGRRKSFFLPTWKPDLTPVSDASTGTIKVFGPPTPDVGDYVNAWSNSAAHRWLQLKKTDGTVAYREIDDFVDNGDGTQDILLDSALVGDIAMVSFLERCRLDSDDVVVEWNVGEGVSKLPCLVVQR